MRSNVKLLLISLINRYNLKKLLLQLNRRTNKKHYFLLNRNVSIVNSISNLKNPFLMYMNCIIKYFIEIQSMIVEFFANIITNILACKKVKKKNIFFSKSLKISKINILQKKRLLLCFKTVNGLTKREKNFNANKKKTPM